MFAIWLLFEKEDMFYLSKIIEELSKNCSSPIFFPHITTYGLVDIKLEELEKIILNSVKGIEPFIIETDNISFSNEFWKTVFVGIKLNKNLNRISKILSKDLEKYEKYKFKPHISLIYKQMSQYEKQELVNKIQIKNDFKISGIGIQKFSENINEWKIVRKYELNKQ